MTETTIHTELFDPDGDAVRLPAAGTFTLDPAHTSIGFVARHLMVAKVRGRFTDFTGSIVIEDGSLVGSAEVAIDTASINTASEQRDAHLRSADFFDTDRYAAMTFRTTSVAAQGGARYTALGQLTIKDRTRPVQLDVDFNGHATDPWGRQRIALTLTAQIDRREFGLVWNAPMENGGVMIGHLVRIEIEAEAVRQ